MTSWSRSAGSRSSTAARSPRSAAQVQTITPATTANISMKVLLRTLVASAAMPNTIGNANPPSPPMTPTIPPTEPMLAG